MCACIELRWRLAHSGLGFFRISSIGVRFFLWPRDTLGLASLGLVVVNLSRASCVARAAASVLALGVVPVVASPVAVLATPLSTPGPLAVLPAAPTTRIQLDLRQRRISVIRNGQRFGPWPVAIGDPKTPTPAGVFKVEEMRVNPQYESTKSGKVNPITGPGSPLGHRWIGFLQQGPNQFGIHGTPWPQWVKIRAAVSNGCVRMLNAHVQQLYELVDVGTPVVISR